MTAQGTAAIVLAGGASRRFGRDKLAQPVDGVPLLERAVAAVAPLADAVVVVLAPGDERVLPDGVTRVHDRDAHQGPLAGVSAGLHAVPASIDRVVVVGGDMPTLAAPVLSALLRALSAGGAVACLADAEGRARPLPMALRRATGLDTTTALLSSGERRLRAVIEAGPTVVILFPQWSRDDPVAATLVDVDRPEDLPDSR